MANTYMDLVGDVISGHAQELRDDLDQARHALQHARSTSVELEHRVALLEGMLAMVEVSGVSEPAPDLTLHEAMVEVLKEAPGEMLRAGDLTAEINGRRLYRMRDGRPAESQQVHARVGHYPHLFTREGTFIKLAR